VNAGVGWDMRAFRLSLPPGTTFYELDYPTTLRERALRLAEYRVNNPRGINRIEIPIDLRSMSLAATVGERLPEDKPVLIIWEGMSMYFQQEEVEAVLAGINPLLTRPESLLWLDVVDREPIIHADRFPGSVQEFMHGMQILGEPFTFGCDHPEGFLADCGMRCLEVIPSDAYFPDLDDPIYSIYKFCVIDRVHAASAEIPSTFRSTRFAGPGALPAAHLQVTADQDEMRDVLPSASQFDAL